MTLTLTGGEVEEYLMYLANKRRAANATAPKLPTTAKLEHDTRLARDLTSDTKPSFAKEDKKVEEIIITETPLKTGRWENFEIAVITYAISRPSGENNRLFKTVVKKLNRSEGSVRAKLSDLGFEVNNGVIFPKG